MSERGEGTRGRILRAARDLFAERDYDGATTRAIAARAGAHQGAVAYHFGTKEKLWKAVVAEGFEKMQAEIFAKAFVIEDLDTPARLRVGIAQAVRLFAREPGLVTMLFREGQRDGPRLDWIADNYLSPTYAALASFLEGARAEAYIPDIPVHHLFYSIVGAASMIFTSSAECSKITGYDPFSEKEIKAHIDALILLFFR